MVPMIQSHYIRSVVPFLLLCLVLVPSLLISQGSYYDGIDTSSSTFVNDLHRLIYNHTKLTYYTTAVAEYAARDTVAGQKYIICVYTGERYVYTPPFSWGMYSREHTWCHSWMPSYPSESGPEYSDQHHLFPTNQNKANSVRSNHPFGIVVQVTNSYLEGKLGYNARGKLVYEPRNEHKGDAARALLYMALCYHGENGYDWSFRYLNQTRLPSLGEDSIEVALLLQWHAQDPPDAWERARNDSVYQYQGNRNPFVDHPEYVWLIDFYTMTKVSSTTLAPEPTNSATDLVARALSDNSMQITWNDAIPGAQAPSGYLLQIRSLSTPSPPTDGVVYSDDTDVSDGTATIHIPYGSTQSITLSNVKNNTLYTVWLYSYNGDGSARNYKTDGTVPSDTCLVGYMVPSNHVVLYSIYGGGGNTGALYKNDFIVLYNPTSQAISLQGWSVQYASATGSTWQVTELTGEIQAYGFYLIAEAAGSGGSVDLPTPDVSGSIPMSATAGKVALCRTTAQLSGSQPVSSDIVDFVGYGTTALFYEGSGPAPAPSNTTYITRDTYGTDTDDNSRDFSVTSDIQPRNSNTEPLSVELSMMNAVVNSEGVILTWRTACELNNFGFEVERMNLNDEKWVMIGFVHGHGTSFVAHSYTFVDSRVGNGAYRYRLKQIDIDGAYQYSPEIEVDVSIPQRFVLFQNYPNPFNPSTTIEFMLPNNGLTTLKVYDFLGREVRVLVNEYRTAGIVHRVEFDGTGLSSGVYIYKLESGNSSVSKLCVLQK